MLTEVPSAFRASSSYRTSLILQPQNHRPAAPRVQCVYIMSGTAHAQVHASRSVTPPCALAIVACLGSAVPAAPESLAVL